MSIIKKMRKLKKNPQKFFGDSENILIKKIGSVFNIKSKAAKNKIQKQEVKVLSNNLKKDNIWYEYINIRYTEFIDTLVYPIGVRKIDQIRLNTLKKYKMSPQLINLWDYFINSEDIDDIEYMCKNNIDYATAIVHSIVNDSIKRNIKFIVLPYDGTILTRFLVIAARKANIYTFCYLISDDDVFSLYENNFSCPICDFILVERDFYGNCKSKFEYLNNIFIIVPEIEFSKNDFSINNVLGISSSESVFVFFAPILQFAIPTKDIENRIINNIRLCIDSMEPNDLLVIFRKRRKKGFFSQKVELELKKIYKKVVIEYHEDWSFNEICKNSKYIYAPRSIFTLIQGKKNMYNATEPFQDNSISLVREFDKNIIQNYNHSEYRNVIQSLQGKHHCIDIIAVPDPLEGIVTSGRQKYLLKLLNAKKRVYGGDKKEVVAGAEYFIQWGAQPSELKLRLEKNRTTLLRPHIFIEDGFIRSFGLWTDPNEPTLSIIFDTHAVYYDALHDSLLEIILNSDFELSTEQLLRAKQIIDKIVSNKISKYNYMPIINLNFDIQDKKRLLLIDQKSGDMSIKYGMAEDDTFYVMLKEALTIDNVEIIIKQHPCAITEGKQYAHYTDETIKFFNNAKNIHLIGFDVNPYSLLNEVDEVWTVTSGMGFEGLLAGKKVRCFGVPFYSNWGITDDIIKLERRHKKRTVEEIFYVFYILLSKYINPNTQNVCTLEELVDYFLLEKQRKS